MKCHNASVTEMSNKTKIAVSKPPMISTSNLCFDANITNVGEVVHITLTGTTEDFA